MIALHDTSLQEADMPIDYFYSHNDMEWRNRKIQIGRRSGRFEVGIGILAICVVSSYTANILKSKNTTFNGVMINVLPLPLRHF